MPSPAKPLNKRLLPAPSDEEPTVVEMENEPPFIGAGETAGSDFYLCCNCGRTLFRRFKPDWRAIKLAFRCRCGQTNVFEQYGQGAE